MMIEERTAEALATAIVELLQDGSRRHQLSARARERGLASARPNRRQKLSEVVDEVAVDAATG